MRDIDGVVKVETETDPNNIKTIVTYDDKKVGIGKIEKVISETDVPFTIEQ